MMKKLIEANSLTHRFIWLPPLFYPLLSKAHAKQYFGVRRLKLFEIYTDF